MIIYRQGKRSHHGSKCFCHEQKFLCHGQKVLLDQQKYSGYSAKDSYHGQKVLLHRKKCSRYGQKSFLHGAYFLYLFQKSCVIGQKSDNLFWKVPLPAQKKLLSVSENGYLVQKNWINARKCRYLLVYSDILVAKNTNHGQKVLLVIKKCSRYGQ